MQQHLFLSIQRMGLISLSTLGLWLVSPTALATEDSDPLEMLKSTPPTVQLEGGLSRFTDPPDALKDLLENQIEAANQRDLDALMSTYSAEFEHEDGLNRQQTQDAVAHLWQEYSALTYAAEVTSWEYRGTEILAVISTEVRGQQSSVRGDFTMTATTEVLNRYRPGSEATDPNSLELIAQDVLREVTILQSGSTPPTVTMKIPEVVEAGSIYGVEAIVDEPLRDTVLLGAVIEEMVGPEEYKEPLGFPLEPLQAGGLFRRADAPADPGSRWISVMLVNEGGVTLESHRLTVTE